MSRTVCSFVFVVLCSVGGAVAARADAGRLLIDHLTDSVFLYQSFSTYQGVTMSANGAYIVTRDGVILIDTPWERAMTEPLLDTIERRHGQRVVLCIATHSHEDRTAGLDLVARRGIPTYTTRRTDSACIANGAPRATHLMGDDTTFVVGGVRFETWFPGHGHAPDNIVVWLPDVAVLIGGCFVKSTEATDLGYTGDADVRRWAAAIKATMQRYPGRRYVVPGHGAWDRPTGLERTAALLKKATGRKRR